MPGFITDAVLQNFVSDVLSKTQGTLIAQWQSRVTAANAMAWYEILGKLSARGYTQAQILAWDAGPVYQQMIGLGLALDMGIVLEPEGYNRAALTAFGYRKSLDTVPVTSGGNWADPAGTPGQAAAGPLDTGADEFVVQDPGDGRLGTPTEF